ncbi:unnamed protein product [Pedinophyceae sp. YPF-701]|nr:unnamed protein product [Pedinophyceae sp. YPF-701]
MCPTNSRPTRGVHRPLWSVHWHAHIRGVAGESIALGAFDTAAEAARAHDCAAVKLRGKQAVKELNFEFDNYRALLEGDMDGLPWRTFLESVDSVAEQGYDASLGWERCSRFRGVVRTPAHENQWEAFYAMPDSDKPLNPAMEAEVSALVDEAGRGGQDGEDAVMADDSSRTVLRAVASTQTEGEPLILRPVHAGGRGGEGKPAQRTSPRFA